MPLSPDVQVVSVDDHVIEHPNVWQDRLPAKFKELGPRNVRDDEGRDIWMFEGRPHYNVGLNAVAGQAREDYGLDPGRLRRHAARVATTRGRARQGHGRRRRVRPALLPHVPRVRRQHVLRRERQGARDGMRVGLQRLDDRRVVRRPPRVGRSRWRWCRSGTSTPPFGREPQRVAARGAPRPSRSPKRRTHSACRRFTPTTGTGLLRRGEDAGMPLCLHFGSGGAPTRRP